MLGQAATGTGKTAAFALPILERLADQARDVEPKALILVPTRELAMQVSEAIHRYGRALGTRVLPIYGGQPIGRQLQALQGGVDIVVATPGRAIDHIKRASLRLGCIQTVVLDEAGEMLDMGFAEDIESILETVGGNRQTVLFSATMPGRIDGLARRHLRDPLPIRVQREVPATGDTPLVRQSAYIVHRAHKPGVLGRVIDVESPTAALVFCRTRIEVDQLTETLNGRGYRALGLHGGLTQDQRDRVMGRLRNGTADLLIATDVAARGLDVEHLTHVINYDVPSAPESYVHRIGRVGRAGREGVAITLAEPREHRLLKNIERLTRQAIAIEKVPTVADLRSRRLARTSATLRETLSQGDLERFRGAVDALADEFDIVEVALAAVKLAHEAIGGSDDDAEIPDAAPRVATVPTVAGHGGPEASTSGPTTRIFVGVGRVGGMREQDLSRAISGRANVSPQALGTIELGDRHALVDVPSDLADQVIRGMRGFTMRGQKVNVRLDRDLSASKSKSKTKRTKAKPGPKSKPKKHRT